MTVPDMRPDLDAPATLVERMTAWFAPVRAWAATEVGGWIIVSALALSVLLAGGAMMVVPRVTAGTELQATAAAATPGIGQDPVIADLADFTLAPEAIQNISEDQARAFNAALPFSADPIRPSSPFFASTTDIESYGRAVDCLTTAVYYEAASETPAGQAAVAQVVLNRARHPAYPRTVCGVVFQGSERTTGCQFSFTCDGAMARKPSAAGWARARGVAVAALNGHVVTGVGTATHYHTDWVAPYWAPRLSKITQIGTHIFYRWKGAWGLPSAFSGVYAAAEPVIPKMAGLSTIAPETAVEILDVSILETPATEAGDAAARVRIALSPIEGLAGAADAEELTTQAPPVAVEPERPTRVLQRDVPIMADPLANPAAPPVRQRQRIAAPSGW